MENGLVKRISEWSNQEIDDEALIAAVEASRPDLEGHRDGFAQVVAELKDEQREACAELIEFCTSMIENTFEALDGVVTGVKEANRNAVFIAGDNIFRNTFQLNTALVHFRNQSLAALGPTDIPNYNLLLSRKDDFLADPSDLTAQLFQEALDSERIIVLESLGDLEKEPDLIEVASLRSAFRRHMDHLNALSEGLNDQAEEADFDTLFEPLDETFLQLQELVPAVQMKLRTTGETDYPDLNYLLNLMEDVAQGNLGDGPLVNALEAVDESFTKSKELLAQAAGSLDSALANDEAAAVLETFEEFEDGMEAIYNFLEQRDRNWLLEAKGCLLDFARRFAEHQRKFKEIEEQQGQVLCPNCSTPNDVSRTRCDQCGGPLPQNVGSSATSTFEAQEKGALESNESEVFVSANIARVYQAVNDVAAGNINHEYFLEEIAKFENIVEANIGSLPSEPAEEGAAQFYEGFEVSIEKFRGAIELFRSYPQSENEEILSQAVLMIDEGARLLAAAGDAV